MPGIIGSTGWDRSSAWIWLFSSSHNTTARSGGLWYRPTTSTTFSTKNGSVQLGQGLICVADQLTDNCRTAIDGGPGLSPWIVGQPLVYRGDRPRLTWVGDTGIEPVTSTVSR